MPNPPRRIFILLSGPHVQEWLGAHVADRGPVANTNVYESSASWELPLPEDAPAQSARLLAHAIRKFQELVPDGKELLDNHASRMVISIEGGPR